MNLEELSAWRKLAKSSAFRCLKTQKVHAAQERTQRKNFWSRSVKYFDQASKNLGARRCNSKERALSHGAAFIRDHSSCKRRRSLHRFQAVRTQRSNDNADLRQGLRRRTKEGSRFNTGHQLVITAMSGLGVHYGSTYAFTWSARFIT